MWNGVSNNFIETTDFSDVKKSIKNGQGQILMTLSALMDKHSLILYPHDSTVKKG